MKNSLVFKITAVCLIIIAGIAIITIMRSEKNTIKPRSFSDTFFQYDSLDVDLKDVYSIKVSGTANFETTSGLIRIVAVRDNNTELLIYENNPLYSDLLEMSFSKECIETCTLTETTNIVKIYIQVDKALLRLTELTVSRTKPRTLVNRGLQEDNKVARLNTSLENQAYLWRANRTSFSELSYSEKKARLMIPSGQPLPNLNGFEYYAGGFFSVGTPKTTRSVFDATIYPTSLDYRNYQGENWITPVKNQGGCGSCWSFCALGSIEAVSMLYFNDSTAQLDLSEQDGLSCSKYLEFDSFCGGCPGGNQGCTIAWAAEYGIVDEDCFPYSETEEDCANKCSSPTEVIYPAGTEHQDQYIRVPGGVEHLRKTLLEYGPIAGGFCPWGHCMTIIGYGFIDAGETAIISTGDVVTIPTGHEHVGSGYFIYKNSWSTLWGEGGYAKVIGLLETDYCYHSTTLVPIRSSLNREVQCVDTDGDGFYYWGIGAEKPDSCPLRSPDEKDCDDTDPLTQLVGDNYHCEQYVSPYVMPPVPSYVIPDITCVDMDGDGFYYWGSSNPKPETCPTNARQEMDCDDRNPNAARIDTDTDTCLPFYPDRVVTISFNEGGLSSPSGEIFVTENSALTLVITVLEGYKIEYIFLNNDLIVEDIVDSPYTYVIQNITEDKKLEIFFVGDTVDE